jgi:hypothetical protein
MVEVMAFVVPAQQLKTSNYVANDRMYWLKDISIDLNKMEDFI